MIGDYLEQYDFDYLINRAMGQVPEDIDKREGSIMYDALAPACYEIAAAMMELKNILTDAFVQTATGEYLDLKAEEHGIKRVLATKARLTMKALDTSGNAYTQINIGDRFSSIDENPIYYSVVSVQPNAGMYTLEAEKAGSVGNQYLGTLLPLNNYNNLASVTTTQIELPGGDDETDDSLRARVLKTYEVNAFGGNIENYIQFTKAIDGVGAVQVYPLWQGGGTVRVVILGKDYGQPSQSLLNSVQEAIAPSGTQSGYGIAPIGHLVTVASPTKAVLDLKIAIDTLVGVNLDDIKPAIKKALDEHFLNVRKTWDAHNERYNYAQVVYRSQIIATLLKIEGVANVANVQINNKSEDYTLKLNNDTQEAAYLGAVTYGS